MNYPMLIAVLAYEVVLIVGIGLWIQRHRAAQRAKDEFALAGRTLPVPVVAVTLGQPRADDLLTEKVEADCGSALDEISRRIGR